MTPSIALMQRTPPTHTCICLPVFTFHWNYHIFTINLWHLWILHKELHCHPRLTWTTRQPGINFPGNFKDASHPQGSREMSSVSKTPLQFHSCKLGCAGPSLISGGVSKRHWDHITHMGGAFSIIKQPCLLLSPIVYMIFCQTTSRLVIISNLIQLSSSSPKHTLGKNSHEKTPLLFANMLGCLQGPLSGALLSLPRASPAL